MTQGKSNSSNSKCSNAVAGWKIIPFSKRRTVLSGIFTQKKLT